MNPIEIKRLIKKQVNATILKRVNTSKVFQSISEMNHMFISQEDIDKANLEILDHHMSIEFDLNLLESRAFFIPILIFQIFKLKRRYHPLPSSIVGSVKGQIIAIQGTYKWNEDGEIILQMGIDDNKENIEYISL